MFPTIIMNYIIHHINIEYSPIFVFTDICKLCDILRLQLFNNLNINVYVNVQINIK